MFKPNFRFTVNIIWFVCCCINALYWSVGYSGCEMKYLEFLFICCFIFIFFCRYWSFYIITCSLAGFRSDGKGWRHRHNINVAPVSSHEGFTFTFPSSRYLCQSRNLVLIYLFFNENIKVKSCSCPFVSSFGLKILKNEIFSTPAMPWLIQTHRSETQWAPAKIKLVSVTSTWQKPQRDPVQLWRFLIVLSL